MRMIDIDFCNQIRVWFVGVILKASNLPSTQSRKIEYSEKVIRSLWDEQAVKSDNEMEHIRFQRDILIHLFLEEISKQSAIPSGERVKP